MEAYKVYVKDEKTSQRVQEHAFILDYEWFSGGKNFRNTRESFLLFNNAGKISFFNTYNEFKHNENIELTPEEFLRLDKPQYQPTHEEIMTHWWKIAGSEPWMKVSEVWHDEEKYRVGVTYYRKDHFVDMEMAKIPPEE